MTKAQIAPRRENMRARIVLEPEVEFRRRQVFDRAGPDQVFEVLVERERLHGLVGKTSILAMQHESELFRGL